MIDNVRNTVLSIISKDNRGYITPEEFNLFAKQAQMEIFEGYMYDYNNAISKQNARMINDGYANVLNKLEEAIDIFRSAPSILTYNSSPSQLNYPLPADIFFINSVIYNGTTEVEKAPYNILNLVSSNMTAPSALYPVYTQGSNKIKVYPTTIITNITLDYIRTPADPKWTWSTLSGGEPLFNQGAADYKDFELPLVDEPRLVVKILQYAGISIREAEIVQAAKTEEVQDKQEKN
jgi:hypothetical protein